MTWLNANGIPMGLSILPFAFAGWLCWSYWGSSCLIEGCRHFVNVVQSKEGKYQACGHTNAVYQTRGEQRQAQADQNLWENLSLESFSKDNIFEVIKGSKRADEENWTQKASQDGQPLGRAKLFAEHLHPSKYQDWQQTGQHQGCTCVYS